MKRFSKFRNVAKVALVALSLLIISHPSWADKRDWLLTYPYWTERKGEVEAAEWHNAGDSVAENPEEAVELEYGVTDRLSSAVYLVRQAGSFRNVGWKFENRYRLAEPGKLVVDPAVYLEYRNNSARQQPDELEGKIILQRYFGDLATATNLVWEKSLGGANPTIRFNRIHLAAAYPLTPTTMDGGVEYTRYFEDQVTSLTPGIYISLSEDVRVLLGWEIPVGGNALPRLRTGFSLEY